MKTKMRKSLFVTLLIVACALLFSCKPEKTPDAGGSGNSGATESYKVICSSAYDGEGVSKIFYAMGDLSNVTADMGNDSQAVAEREIVLGNTTREISKIAYERLERLEVENEKFARYLIYSDGVSVAVAYETDRFLTNGAHDAAIESFIKNYVTGKEIFETSKGVIDSGVVDLVAYQREIDTASRETAYNSIRSSVINSTGDAALADDIVEAFRNYYALTTPNIVSWLANLYEPDIDSATRGENDPVRGGFYYSNSGRDTEGFLPDLESTAQALMIIHYSGLVDHIGGQSGLPDWFKEQIGNFAKSLQDPNGFFYHPQWGKDATDRNQERRARDTGSALSLIGLAGMQPTYSIYERVGDGTLIDGTKVDASGNVIEASAVNLTKKLSDRDIATAVSKVVPTAQTYVSPELLTEEAFYAWLDGGCGYKIQNGSYGWGSFVCSRVQEYLQRDKQLAAEGADWRCSDVLIDYLNEHQNPENGTWEWGGEDSDRYWYNCVNGLLKIGSTYTSFGVEMPYALEACQTAIKAITSETTPIHICDVYNPWFAVSNTLKNLSTCSANRVEGNAKLAEVRNALLADAPETITKTLEKRALFKKVDGSFSYFPGNSSQYSTGMPVALKEINEGDVNATVIAAIDIRDRMCNALGLPTVDILGKADYIEFITILEELDPVIKDDNVSTLDPITFDGYLVGDVPNDGDINTENLKSGGASGVVSDPRPGAEGNVFRFEKVAGKGDILRFPTGDGTMGSNCSVFEAEMCFESSSIGYTVQLSLDFNYMLGIRFDSERCYFFDTSSSTANRVDSDFEKSVAIGEWFKLRIEYYPGDEDTVRIKVYLNDELIAVSDNYYDYYGYKITNGTGKPASAYSYAEVLGMSGARFVLLMDNVTVGKIRTSYKVTTSDPPLAVDVDAPVSEEKVYDFEDSESANGFPEDFTVSSGSDTVEIRGEDNKSLYIKGNKGDSFKIEIPTTRVSESPNRTTVSMDVSFLSYDVGATVQLGLRQRGSDFLEYAVTGYILKIEELDGKKYVVMYEYIKDTLGAQVGGIKIPAENTFNLKIEYYTAEKTTLIYIDDDLLGLSSAVIAGVEKYKIGKLVIQSTAKLGYEVLLDNIVAENGTSDFTEATKPGIESVIHTFDSSDGITLGGGAKISGGYATLTGGGYVTVPLNKRSISAGTVILDAKLSLSNTEGDSSIVFTDSDGNSIIVYTLKVKGGKVYIHETTEKMTYAEPIASFEAGRLVNLLIEYYTAKDIIQISVDGKCIAVSSLQYNSVAANSEITAVKLGSASGTLTVDELIIEGYNKLYTEFDTDGDNLEDNAETFTFESSTDGNLPKRVTASLTSGGASVKIDEFIGYTETSKAIVLNTNPGGADTLNIEAGSGSAGANCVVFEADIAINVGTYMFFNAGSKTIYRINLNPYSNTGKLNIDDNPGFPPYGTMKNPESAIKLGKWGKIRIELYNKTDGTVAARVAINGYYLVEGNEPSWSGNVSDITNVQMTTSTGGKGYFALDNLYFGPGKMTIDPDVEPPVVDKSGPETFEDYDVGDFDGGIMYNDGGASIKVKEENGNKYYEVAKPTKTEDYLYVVKKPTTPAGANCILFETKMRINDEELSGCSVNIIYGRWNGMQKLTLAIDAGSDVISIADWRSGATTTLNVADIGAKEGEWFTLRVENYTNSAGETIARVYVNGICIGESTNAGVLGSASELHHLNSLVVKANNNIIGSVDFDDLYFGQGVMLAYDARPVEDFEDGVHSISIDGGSVKTPGSIKTDGDNSYYNKPTDTSDYLYFQKSSYEPDGADCIVFEAKIRINHTTSSQCSFNIIYGRWNGMKKFTLSTAAGSDVIKLDDWRDGTATSLSVENIGAKLGEWFTLRIENYLNGKDETIARVYVNGILIGESTNIGVLGSASANHTLNTVSLLLNNNIKGSVDIDDVYLGNDKMIVDESVSESTDTADGVTE